MRKLSAILLLALFLFNLAGYRLLFDYAQYVSDTHLDSVLDKDQYDENDLVAIKLPLSLPYQVNWKEAERADGEITLNGKIYRYVKRMYANGEMTYWCLPNTKKMQLQTAKDDFFEYANDLMQNNSSKKHSNTTFNKNVVSDYDSQQTLYQFFSFNRVALYENPLDVLSLLQGISNTPAQPPEANISSIA
ncbi:MAG: hypothetical protein ACTHJ5_13450 [Ilyomonas sp.]